MSLREKEALDIHSCSGLFGFVCQCFALSRRHRGIAWLDELRINRLNLGRAGPRFRFEYV